MKARLKSILAAALCAVGITAFAEPVSYLDWDDVNKKMTNAICTAFELVTADTATFEAGKTYVVQGTVEQSVHGITVEGTSSNPTRLILCDGAKLTVTGQSFAETAGLNVSNGTAIVICGQTDGTGVLETTGGSGAAGIGGNAGQTAGTVTIYGGSVTALGKIGAAGIGGGMNKTDTGTVTFGGTGFSVVTGKTATVTAPIAQDDYVNNHSAAYVHIKPPLPGSQGNSWAVGEGVTAYTNGTTLVIGGEGSVEPLAGIDGLKDLLADLTAINITSNGVTGVASDAFQGVGDGEIALTLPDGWQGELPDEDGNWYGATGVTLTAMPLTVKNVKFLQRYPWNGKVDVGFTLTGPAGETNVVVMVRSGESEVATFTAAVTIPADGVLATNLVWDAATAGLAANFKSDDVTVEVAFAGGAADPTAPVQLWADGPYFATCNVGASTPEEYGWYFWWGDTVGYTNSGSAWVSVVDGTSIQFNGNDPTATNTYKKTNAELKSLGYIDDDANPVLNAAHDAAKVKLGDLWRMMTKVELDALTNTAYCTSVWTDNWNNTGVKGYIVTGNTSGYTGKSIFLPAAGYGNGANIINPGANGCYWSSTTDLDNSTPALRLLYALNISFVSSAFRAGGLVRYRGGVVRAVRDTPPEDTPAPPAISAKSAAGALDLTVGDRVAKDVEPLVIDPAWGAASEAQVQIDGEPSARSYSSAGVDTWLTASLEPGRYAMALTAGTDAESAAFWKTGADWVVFDSSNITADVTFEADKTYLILGTNMVSGATLTVLDGAKFFYDEGAPAGFKAASVVELPKRYKIADGDDPADESKLFQIVEKLRGSEDNPWDVGEGVTAYTNGTAVVIGGEGTISDLSAIPADVKGGITAINVASNGVAGVASGAFQGIGDGEIALTLPDGWQGELPDEGGNWYGATGVTLTAMPLTVKNVKPQQRYPWNGLVDINFNLTGEGMVNVAALVTTNGVALANPTVTGETVFDLGGGKELKNLKLVWDAKADLPANFTCDDVVIEVTAGRQKTDGDYMVIDLSADGNGRFAVSYEDMDVASAIEKYNTDEYKTGKLVLKKIPAGTAYPCEPRMIDDVTSAPIGGTMTPAKDYFIGLFETTAAQYDRVMGVEAPSDATTPKNCISYNMIRNGDDSWDIEPTDPVAAESFMGILAAKTGVAGFDLPTEIQWEIAARAGSTAEYGSYIGEDGGAVVGVYNSSAAPWGNTTNFMWFVKNNNPAGVKSVGLLRPNLWGLYDTAGNVYEFCLDVYNEDKTSWDDVETPEADGDSYKRALRGGYFAKAATVSRPSVRSSGYSDGDGINIGAGFRLCRTVATAGSSTSATATSTSEAFAVDLREDVELAEGETTISNVTWSATLWGELDEEFVTAIGWTNLTTGATGVFSNLARVVGDAAEDVDLPKKDGDYVLTHSTGDLTSFVTFVVSGYPLGCETNPWKVGPKDDPDSVIAWTDGAGTVYFKPPRSDVSREGLETITNALGGTAFDMQLVSEDGAATNDVRAIIGASDRLYTTLDDALASDEDEFALYDVNGVPVNLPAGVAGQTFVVSNLTAGTVITPSSTLPGGAEYVLPLGANIAIYAVPSGGYRLLEGTNPIVIDKVTVETTVDTSVLPAAKSLAEASQIGDSDVSWRIDDDALVIEGEGAMPDFDEANPVPWNEFADKITAISVGEAVEHLGNAAFSACNGATAITLANEEGVVNLAAFVSPDGSETSFPSEVDVVEDGVTVQAVRFRGDAEGDYDSLEAAYAAGETGVAPLTMSDLKDEAYEGLEELAGSGPRSMTMFNILRDARNAIDRATTPGEIETVVEEQGEKIAAQLDKESPKKIGDSDVTWRIEDGILYIEGSGDMPDFTDDEEAPWNEFADEITAISVGEAVEHLGNAAFSACNGATAITLANEEGVVNLAAFVSPDGSETNFPADILVVEDGESAPAVRFEGDAEEDYDSLAAAYAAGETDVSPLTLNNVKAGYVEGLEELAGPAPRSEEMQQLLNEAIDAVLAATTAAEADTAAEDKGFPVSVLAAKEAVEKAAGDPAKRSRELRAAVDEALAAIDAAKTIEEVALVRAAALAVINELVGKAGELYPDGDGGVFVAPDKATAYEGVVLDASGEVAGTINVKLSKPSKKGVMKVTATVKNLADGKTYSYKLKDVSVNVNGPLVITLDPSNKKSAAHALTIVIEGDSLKGIFDDGSIDAACNVFKRKGDPMRDAVKPIVGIWTGAFISDAGEILFSARLRKSGSASVKVMLPNGKKATSSSKIEVGDGIVAVPVTVRKVVKGVTMTFGFRLAFIDGADGMEVINVTPLETRDRSKKVLSSDVVELLAVGMQNVSSKEFKMYQVAVDPALEAAFGPVTKNSLKLSPLAGLISGSLKFGKVSGTASGIVVNGVGLGKVSVRINRVKYDYQFVATPPAEQDGR